MTRSDPLEGKKVLVVDDEQDVLDTVEELLEMCKTSKAASFKEAKDLMENQPFDIAYVSFGKSRLISRWCETGKLFKPHS